MTLLQIYTITIFSCGKQLLLKKDPLMDLYIDNNFAIGDYNGMDHVDLEIILCSSLNMNKDV